MARVSPIAAFVVRVAEEGRARHRDLPWRATRDPYAVLVSEVMLQQTQVARVLSAWESWLATFPTPDALAAAPLEPVLLAWQGLGYNRRAIALKRAAEEVSVRFGGSVPADEADLRSLPGVGAATAAGVLAFAFDRPVVYLETNVRAVVLHELFAERDAVSDREIVPLLAQAVEQAAALGVGPREWYYALLDYGSALKRTLPNPSRRSAHHVRQSRFEGSRRQKRAWLLRAVMANPGRSAEEYAQVLGLAELAAERPGPPASEVSAILDELAQEGFLRKRNGRWLVAQ
jgi:A/G-specific adenine glycosylase